jgi:hypothetical protein
MPVPQQQQQPPGVAQPLTVAQPDGEEDTSQFEPKNPSADQLTPHDREKAESFMRHWLTHHPALRWWKERYEREMAGGAVPQDAPQGVPQDAAATYGREPWAAFIPEHPAALQQPHGVLMQYGHDPASGAPEAAELSLQEKGIAENFLSSVLPDRLDAVLDYIASRRGSR